MAKMKIFISWSGPRSAAVAGVLKEYLPVINNAFEPWLSSDDIPKGSRSAAEIADALVAAKAGIICLTPSNLNAPWILYEAGGIAKTVERPLACTLLIDLEPSDVSKPLGDFQHTRLQEKELLKLVKTLNNAAGENARQDADVDKAFKLCWPELKQKLDTLPPDGTPGRPKRTDRELLEELVDSIRAVNDAAEGRAKVAEEHFLVAKERAERLAVEVGRLQAQNVRLDALRAELNAAVGSAEVPEHQRTNLARKASTDQTAPQRKVRG